MGKQGKRMVRENASEAEFLRLEEDVRREKNWKRWGPYLAERQWGTVREDYSEKGDSWEYFSHEEARSRAYRWGEDGLMGVTDRKCRLCFALALWNGKDSFLKERLYGLTGPQGNHGEDCKELYYYLDSTPTHSYFKGLYKYPQGEFPYQDLVEENARRGLEDREYELLDTGVFAENRYFDIFAEYAKGGPNDLLIQIEINNRGPDKADLHFLPTLWFRNTWIWGCEHEGCTLKPRIERVDESRVLCEHESLGRFYFAVDSEESEFRWLFTENESNSKKLWGAEGYTPYVKDAFHEFVVGGDEDAVNPACVGTKAAPLFYCSLEPGERRIFRFRLVAEGEMLPELFGGAFERTMQERRGEAEGFYESVLPVGIDPESKQVIRQAYAGLLWSKQFYHYSVADWLKGDKDIAAPPEQRLTGRNAGWKHLFNRDVISMPDKWEYPWYAAWDLAFHVIPFARIDSDFAKDQMILMLREWYMHPNGQIPAYEWAFDDVNPPVHAWACWRLYKMTAKRGERDLRFLGRAFHKLLLNFTWWVNRKDPDGHNLFSGGFLGLDNIGVFDRSKPLPNGGQLVQADGTAWMAFYCSTMLSIALELACHDETYEGIASKFFEHFMGISDAINTFGGTGLWDDLDGFYYDQLRFDRTFIPLQIRSMVGLIPLFAVEVLDAERIASLKGFKKRMDWFMTHRKDLAKNVSFHGDETNGHYLLAILQEERLRLVLRYLLSEDEFLSPYGVRSLSKYHKEHPFRFECSGEQYEVSYVPGESNSYLFGGNSNWRGPIWLPVNYLLIESLEKYHHVYGDAFQVEYPTGSGVMKNLGEIARDLSERLVRLFLPDESGRRPCHGDDIIYAENEDFEDLLLFYEYFHGDDGRGIGASHQTGWTALVAKLIQNLSR